MRRSSSGSNQPHPSKSNSAPVHLNANKNNNNYKRGKYWNNHNNVPKRPVPYFKIIPGTEFLVDGFQYKDKDRFKHYFLSHFHADHYMGITKGFNHGLIYCSQITANCIFHKFKTAPEYIRPLAMNQKHMIEGVEVELLEANHCPGAVLFLFRTKDSKYFLHTGDFRYSSEMKLYPSLQNISIEGLLLDTTFLDPKYSFPPQAVTIQSAVSAVKKEIGKEKVLTAVAAALQKRIYVTQEKYKLLECLNIDMNVFTRDENSTNIDVVPLGTVNFRAMLEMRQSGSVPGRYKRIVGIAPSGWNNRPGNAKNGGENLSYRRSGDMTIYGIPYSEHSSYTELLEFVSWVNARQIIPTVKTALNHQIQNLVKQYRAQQRQPQQGTLLAYLAAAKKKRSASISNEGVVQIEEEEAEIDVKVIDGDTGGVLGDSAAVPKLTRQVGSERDPYGEEEPLTAEELALLDEELARIDREAAEALGEASAAAAAAEEKLEADSSSDEADAGDVDEGIEVEEEKQISVLSGEVVIDLPPTQSAVITTVMKSETTLTVAASSRPRARSHFLEDSPPSTPAPTPAPAASSFSSRHIIPRPIPTSSLLNAPEDFSFSAPPPPRKTKSAPIPSSPTLPLSRPSKVKLEPIEVLEEEEEPFVDRNAKENFSPQQSQLPRASQTAPPLSQHIQSERELASTEVEFNPDSVHPVFLHEQRYIERQLMLARSLLSPSAPSPTVAPKRALSTPSHKTKKLPAKKTKNIVTAPATPEPSPPSASARLSAALSAAVSVEASPARVQTRISSYFNSSSSTK